MGLNASFAGVMIPAGPVTEQGWRNALECRLQKMIEYEAAEGGNPVAIINHVLETEDVPTLRDTEKASWAEILFAAVPAIRISLNASSQTWPATVTTSDTEIEALMSDTKLEEWLYAIST